MELERAFSIMWQVTDADESAAAVAYAPAPDFTLEDDYRPGAEWLEVLLASFGAGLKGIYTVAESVAGSFYVTVSALRSAAKRVTAMVRSNLRRVKEWAAVRMPVSARLCAAAGGLRL